MLRRLRRGLQSLLPLLLYKQRQKEKIIFVKFSASHRLRLGAEKNEYKIGVLMDLVICGISAAAYVIATDYLKKKLIKLTKVKNND